MQKYKHFLPLILACLLVSLPAQAGAPSKPELMTAVFGAHYRSTSGDALVQLPMNGQRHKIRWFRVKPLASETLNTGDTILLAQADYDDKNTQNDNPAIEDEAYLNIFVLRQAAGKWTVIRRHENVMMRGESSGPGSVMFPMLNKDKQVLALANYTSNDGCPAGKLYLIDLAGADLRHLTEGIPLRSTSADRCGAADGAPELSTNSTWFLAPPRKAGLFDDVVVNSVTSTVTYASGDRLIETKGKKVTTRYAYDGTRYQLVGGTASSAAQQ
jgi:hypothetical protein